MKRRIERDAREEEIEKSRRAIERWKEHGYDHGRPRFGMTHDEDGHYQVPGEEFDTVMEIFQLDNAEKSRLEIAGTIDIPVATIQNVIDRREQYINRKQMEVSQGLSIFQYDHKAGPFISQILRALDLPDEHRVCLDILFSPSG